MPATTSFQWEKEKFLRPIAQRIIPPAIVGLCWKNGTKFLANEDSSNTYSKSNDANN